MCRTRPPRLLPRGLLMCIYKQQGSSSYVFNTSCDPAISSSIACRSAWSPPDQSASSTPSLVHQRDISVCSTCCNLNWSKHQVIDVTFVIMAKMAAATWSYVVMLGIILCLGACNGVSARLNPRHKTHNVTFYVHEAINTGDDANAFIVAGPGGNTSALQQGAIVVVDEGIFASADPNSKQLGKWQGLYIVDGGQKYRAEITVTIDQPGDLIECTYEILGQRPSFNTTSDRQLVVVGGSGLFLGQKGYAIAHTVSQTILHEDTLPSAQYNVQQWTLVVGK